MKTKIQFKNTTIYNQKTLKESYKKLRSSVVWILLTICSFIAIILNIIVYKLYNYTDLSNIILLFIPLITWLCCIPYSRTKFHIMNLNARYHSTNVKYEFDFDEEKIWILNTISWWKINIYYKQCNKIYETKNLYVINYEQRYLICLDKKNFSLWNKKEFKEFINNKLKENKKNILKTISV